ncbi:hypothetical protein AB2762_02945 [Acinetobacter indicus]
MADVAERIAVGRRWNAGQTCVAPDYMFLPKGKTAEFLGHYEQYIKQMLCQICATIRITPPLLMTSSTTGCRAI